MNLFSFIAKHRLFFTLFVFVALLFASFNSQVAPVYAVAGFSVGGLPVGGTIATMNPCTCGYTAWLAAMYVSVVGKDATKSGTYTYSATLTDTHSNWMVRPGAGMLGTYIPGIQACWMQAAFACFPLPTRGLLTSIGTGLTP